MLETCEYINQDDHACLNRKSYNKKVYKYIVVYICIYVDNTDIFYYIRLWLKSQIVMQ